MKKCFKCGGTQIAAGRITRSSHEFFSDIVFKPEKLRFLALTVQPGTSLDADSYACLECGTVWSQTNPHELRDFIRRNCKPSKHKKGEIETG